MVGRHRCSCSGVGSVSGLVFLFGNLAFLVYCSLAVPKLQGPHLWLVRAIVVYVGILGLAQLLEAIFTGSGSSYGKFIEEQSDEKIDGWYKHLMRNLVRPTIPGRIAWWTMEQPSVIVPLVFLCLFLARGGSISAGCVFLGLFVAHYMQRSFVYAFRTRGKAYPTVFWVQALTFTCCNGTLQALDLLHSDHLVDLEVLYSPCAIIGILTFLFGMYTNIRCDSILRNLRQPGETDYKLPTGFMFEYVSGANLWGEIVEWTGFALATRTLGSITFALFCWAGIGSRCVATHKWYVRKFGETYPSSRKCLIPFVW